MASVAFHFNTPNKLEYVLRLLRKAANGQNTVAVVADSDTLSQLDEHLWSFSATDFLVHGRQGVMSAAHLSNTSIWLIDRLADMQARDVLVNLLPTIVDGFERFPRVIEVVTEDEADRQRARLRWRQYAERGHVIERHDLKPTS